MQNYGNKLKDASFSAIETPSDQPFTWNPWIVLKNKTEAQGVILDLYDKLKGSGTVDFTYQYDAPYGGFIGPDGKWNGMIGDMINNVTDLAGPIFINEARAKAVDFAFPVDFSQLVIITGLVPAHKDPFLIFGVFPLAIWLLIFLAIFLSAATACLVYYLLSPSSKNWILRALLRYMWEFQIALIGKGFAGNNRWFMRDIWSNKSFRCLQSFWFLGCLVLMYVFQGTMVSTYAANRLKPQFESLEDFLNYPSVIVGTYENSYPVLCLEKLVNTRLESVFERIKKNLIKMDKGIPPWLDAVEAGKAAYIADTLYAKSIIGERFRVTGKCNIRVSTFDLCSGYIGLACRKGLKKKFLRSLDNG
ncbi:glutamate receptor ionotropic, kainate 5-like [Argiope bruennichi]|uniref:glutamate receptor ionotropic, kainate 5-like n=1 Tax=Argiope bruennichi TaxID=94029 RepID=UPI00249534B6|nr:glutamate receptor ionotropic, kainate 5-like [Argiope bruennichi]